MRQFARILRLLALVCLWPALAAGAEPTSIEEFNRQSENWERLKGPTLRLEGRCSILTESRLLMTECDLTFVFDDSVLVPSIKPKNVEVTGRLDTRQAKLVFVVTQIKPLPGDLESLRLRRAEIDTQVPGDWYGLADWAVARGAFYDDNDLREQATELYRNGVLAESRSFPVTAVEPLLALAEKARGYGLPASLSQQLVHKAIVRQLEAARRANPPDYAPVLTRILEKLPGSNRPLELDETALSLQHKYLADREATYEALDVNEQRRLHRLIYLDAAQTHLESGAKPDGSNGFAIAAALDDSLPELAERADEFREREIQYQIQSIKTLSRETMLELVQRLEDRQRGPRAEEMKRRWLSAQEARYRQRGAIGRFELVEEFLTLTGDREKAVELLVELHGEQDFQQLAANRLVELGYRFGTDGTWTPAEDVERDDFDDAISRGVIRPGMTEDQIQGALGGRPDQVVRFASGGGITELWVYSDHNVSILMKRRFPDQPREALEISNTGAAPK